MIICWLLTGCWDQLTGTGVAFYAVWPDGGTVGSETTEDQRAGRPPAAAQLWVTSVFSCVCLCICEQTVSKVLYIRLNVFFLHPFNRWHRWAQQKLSQWNRNSRVSVINLSKIFTLFFSMYYIIVYTATCCSSSKYEMLTKTNLNIKKVYTRSVKIGTVLMFLWYVAARQMLVLKLRKIWIYLKTHSFQQRRPGSCRRWQVRN